MVCAFLQSVSLVIIVYASVTHGETYNYDYTSYTKQYTRRITLKQGILQGIVVEPRVNRALSPVEQYLGIPYAAPPVGDLRFMPPGSAPSWFGLKYADSLGAVCPQKLPNMNAMEASRKEYFNRLIKYLKNESEDCLYLNIYAPLQDISRPYANKYPVMVFIHGESFEWNSGNPYDGSVLASYGKVIVVTLNFRLGILGFLKVGLEDNASSNFGLVDQVAALLWIQENIAAFGGDPNSITLFGHGTGAACISMLMLSPMVAREGKPLFHRAILMSGTALSDWAMASTSQQVTYQVAEALNCPTDEKLAACLRKKRINEIMGVAAATREYTTRFGPIVDGLVIPNDPNKIMSSYNDFFRRFELMYGLTEVESVHLLEPVALTYGLLEKERDQELRKYLYARYEHKPEYYVAHTLAMYTGGGDGVTDQMQSGYTGHEPDRASVARDMLLDMLSDARSAAPVALMARYHAAVNPQSYFYIFGHTTASREFLRNKTAHGEELPYVFGVPLDGPKFHFQDHYNNQERLFSEAVMALWTNFAHSGDPNIRRKNEYLTLYPKDWRQYDIEWPEFDRRKEQYLYLAIPPEVRDHYRSREIHYWNDALPNILKNNSNMHIIINRPPPRHPPQYTPVPRTPQRNLPPWFQKGTSPDKHVNLPDKKEVFGTIKLTPDDNSMDSKSTKKEYGTVITAQTPTKASGTAMIVLIIVGGIFLLINVVLFVALYYKCAKIKSRESSQKRSYEDPIEVRGSISAKRAVEDDDDNGCSIMKMISKSSKSEDTYEAVKISEDGSSKYKLRREMSASTIDPHTKVRDWIAHEIVQRCSPKFLRPDETHASTHVRTDSKTTESYSTLGRSPTRPVSPVEGEIISRLSNIPKPKPQKVSVGIDATPAARSPSVLRQQPIELTKSLDYSSNSSREIPMRRSNTVDNFLDAKMPNELRRSTTNIDLNTAPTIVKIEHHHAKSKSEPVQNFDRSPYATLGRKMKTFDPTSDINVTSREEDDDITPLTPEESLMTIKRRNYPKVLPDYPDKQYLMQKRRSMPVPNQLFLPIPENAVHSQPNSPTSRIPSKFPPAPPPRSTSSLGRTPVNTSPFIQSSAMVAEEPPVQQEPDITCNSLYIGPLIPSRENRKIDMNTPPQKNVDSQPLYDNLRSVKDEVEKKYEKLPKTIITTDPNNPIKKLDAKVIIKPTITRNTIDRNRAIPRVTAKDNVDKDDEAERNRTIPRVTIKDGTPADKQDDENVKTKTSQIPKLVKAPNANLNKEGSSESSPSEESETGTVIKRV